MAKPTTKPDWIPDDTTGIIAPSESKQNTGWTSGEKPPFQYFNWFWNLISQWIAYLSKISDQYNITIGDDGDDDYTTLVGYIADSPTAGDRVFVKTDQTVTSLLIIPQYISIKFQKGKKIICASNITNVIQITDEVHVEGDLVIELSHTGTIAYAVYLTGDNMVVPNLVVNNTSTGTVTKVVRIFSTNEGNFVNGYVINAGGGTISGVIDNHSANLTNEIIIKDKEGDIIHRAVDLPVVSGGTGASNAADARTNLGLGTIATQAANNVSISGGSISGITDLAVADGGTGSSSAAGALTNLGLSATADQINRIMSAGRINRCELVYQSARLVTVSFPWTEPGGTAWTNVAGIDIHLDVAGGGNVKNGITPNLASTWYYIYLLNAYTITQPTITQFMATTNPAGEVGYTIIGAIYNNAAQDIRPFDQQGRVVLWQEEVEVLTGTALIDWTDLTLTDVGCYRAVPFTAKIAKLAGNTKCQVASSDDVTIYLHARKYGAASADATSQVISGSRVYQSDHAEDFGYKDVAVNTGVIQYKVTGAGSASAYAFRMLVTGYHI